MGNINFYLKLKLFCLFVILSCTMICSSQNIRETNLLTKDSSIVEDFTIITTDHDTLNLYSTLSSGKTVVLDFFYTTCYYCQAYASIIEQSYQNNGAGNEGIVFWGIDYGDTDTEVIAYKTANSITNPCASGINGNGDSVAVYFSDHYNLTGFPSYAVICPNKKVFWDVNRPPTVTGFDSFFDTCQATGVNQDFCENGLVNIYPNPLNDLLMVEIKDYKNSIIEIYNSAGILLEDYIINNYRTELYTGQLSSGFYTIKIKTKRNVISKKIIKQ